MMRLLPRSLLNRVFVLYSLTLGLTLGAGMAVVLKGYIEREVDGAGDTANMVIEIAAQAIVDAVVVNDLEAVQRTLVATVTHTPFASAHYIEIGGKVLAAQAATANAWRAPAPLSRWVAESLPAVNRVIVAGGRDYGVLRLDFMVDDVAGALWDTGTRALMLGVGALALGLLLTRQLLAHWLSNLRLLGHHVEQMQVGEPDVPSDVSRDAPEEVRRAFEQIDSATRGMRDKFGQRIDALTHKLVQHKAATDEAVIVIELDTAGIVTDVNDLFCAVSGWSRPEFLGRCDGWSLQPASLRDFAPSALAAPCWTGEVSCQHKDGTTVWVKRTLVPMRDEDGRLEKIICLDIDISRTKAAERTLKEEKDRAEVTLHSIADGVLTLDASNRIEYANPAALSMLGVPAAGNLENKRPDQLMQVIDSVPIEGRRGAGVNTRSTIRLHSGQTAVIELSRAALHDVNGQPTGEVIAFRDVSNEHRIRQELKRLSLAVQHAASGIIVTDPQGRIEYANPRFTQLTGFTFPEIRGQTPRFLKSGQTPSEIYDAMWSAMRDGRTWRGELLNRRKDGLLFWCSLTLSAVMESAPRPAEPDLITGPDSPRQFVAVMEDVSDRKAAEETIHRLAYFDVLTDLPNRRMFMERAVEAVNKAQHSGQPLAVCYLDLDGFKNVNDTLGHLLGDALLAAVAQRISACLRPNDFLGRLGGDEFALLLHEPTTIASVDAVGQRILKVLDRAVVLEGKEIVISTSIGVSMYPDDGQDVGDLLRKADMALYRAKEGGGRKLVFFTSEIEDRIRDRSEMELALREALQRGELRLQYQPKIDLVSKAVIGAEALLRWQHPVKGMLAPDRFIAMAEETRLIVPIGRWVFEQACAQIMAWQGRGMDDVRVAVNISSVQFRSPELADEIECIVAASGIRPEQIELEITESGLMEDPAGVARILQRLRAIGLTIAIDDFGTGYSSLAYLKSFPVSVLKIDRSFVRDLENDVNDRGIAEAVISMARVLRVDVVAEGVETRGQLEILEAMGCQLAQGYFFSRPLDPAAFETYWWRHRAEPCFMPTAFQPQVEN
jgi:diguanylate cyclase (GGDEF)-like protein/PAS domain S-box-containing protein